VQESLHDHNKGQYLFICYLYAFMACKETNLLYNKDISNSGNVVYIGEFLDYAQREASKVVLLTGYC